MASTLAEVLKFNIICLAGLVLNVLVNLVFNFLLNRYVANAIALATIWNFWVNLKLSWRVTQEEIKG